MMTTRFPEPRGIDAETRDYGFYVRVRGSRRAMLLHVRDHLTKRFGTAPSNPKLLDELLAAFPLHETGKIA